MCYVFASLFSFNNRNLMFSHKCIHFMDLNCVTLFFLPIISNAFNKQTTKNYQTEALVQRDIFKVIC